MKAVMREHFLSNLWKRYPVRPLDAVLFGRLQEVRRNLESSSDAIEVEVVKDGKVQVARYCELSFATPTNGKLSVLDVLVPGDLIAINAAGAVTLLAPRLAPLLSRDFQPERLRLWQEYLGHVRDFFRQQGFVEIATPSLVQCPGTEPSLDPFATEFVRGSERRHWFLPTSPELHLKKALSLGAEKIFEIRSCFRNGEITQHHQPEFTMIEWYRAYEGLSSIQQDVQNLIVYLVEKNPSFKVPNKIETSSIAELFRSRCGFELKPTTAREELRNLVKSLSLTARENFEIDDYFFLLFLEKIESAFDPETLTFVTDYPPYQAALARISEQGWGERFEVYWQGLELANAFHELNDPEIQKARFQEDLQKKKYLGKEPVPLDPEFMQCLEAGMPPASGIALGVERLFMALTGITEISATRLFPQL